MTILATIFDANDYPVEGKLYLKNDGEIVLKALARLTAYGNFDYAINKFPKEIFKKTCKSENTEVINIKADEIPLYYAWEFIPMNLKFDIIKGKIGRIEPNFSFSMKDEDIYYGSFVPLVYNGNEICKNEICITEVY